MAAVVNVGNLVMTLLDPGCLGIIVVPGECGSLNISPRDGYVDVFFCLSGNEGFTRRAARWIEAHA
jgi:hypothetical protein